MTDVINIAGYLVPISAVLSFVATWVMPPVMGFLSSKIVKGLKEAGYIDLGNYLPVIQSWGMRGIVAVICAILSVAGDAIMQQPITLALFLQAVYAYFAAITTHEHTEGTVKVDVVQAS